MSLLLGAFGSDEALLRAARAARERGLRARDAFTPFPVHGLDEALGLPPSPLPKVCLALGLLGLASALGFQYWVSLFDWPMNIGGKPFDASPALVPVAFEITILFGGLGTVAAFLWLRGLRPGRRPPLIPERATDDLFYLAFDPAEAGAPARELEAFLKAQGALAVRSEP